MKRLSVCRNKNEAAKYAIMFDTLPEKVTYTSLLLRGLGFDIENTAKKSPFTECTELYNRLQWDRYGAIRGDERFKAIIERISEYRSE